jgi:murein DD-endopeptidase MepM/ murein hydrolase activator NlpD
MPAPSPASPNHGRLGARPARRSRTPLRLAAVAALAVPLLLAAVLGAPALLGSPPASPSATPNPIGGPAVALPGTPLPVDPSPTATPPPATPTPTPAPSPTVAPEGPTSDPPEELTGYVWPLRGARFTSPFGQRDGGFMILNGQPMHDGIDMATWCGDRIRSAHDGTVLYAGRKFDDYLGYSDSMAAFYARLERTNGLRQLPIVVVIDDGNGYRSVYVHLTRASVEAGDVVAAGEVIGYEGATGNATGCHLHYGLIRMDGEWAAVAEGLVQRFNYAPFVRVRVDPLLVLPLTHADAPAKIRRANTIPFDRQRIILELD